MPFCSSDSLDGLDLMKLNSLLRNFPLSRLPSSFELPFRTEIKQKPFPAIRKNVCLSSFALTLGIPLGLAFFIHTRIIYLIVCSHRNASKYRCKLCEVKIKTQNYLNCLVLTTHIAKFP